MRRQVKKDSFLPIPDYLLLSTGWAGCSPLVGHFDNKDHYLLVIYNYLNTLPLQDGTYYKKQKCEMEDKRTETKGGTEGEEKKSLASLLDEGV